MVISFDVCQACEAASKISLLAVGIPTSEAILLMHNGNFQLTAVYWFVCHHLSKCCWAAGLLIPGMQTSLTQFSFIPVGGT